MPKMKTRSCREEALQGDGHAARSCAGRRCGATTWRRSRRSVSAASARIARSRAPTAARSRRCWGWARCRGSSEQSHAHKKRRKVLEQAKGYWGRKSTHYRYAKEQVEHSLVYAYRDRKVRKRSSGSSGSRGSTPPPARTGSRTTSSCTAARRPGSSSTGRCSPTSRSATRGAFGAIAEQAAKAALAESGHRDGDRLITSRDNERLKLVRKLHDRRWRDKLGLFAVEGEDLVEAAAERRTRAGRAARRGRGRRAGAARGGLDARASAARDRRVPAGRPAARSRGPTTLALWHVGDPGNVGTLLRAADAFGAGVALSAGCADPTGPKARARVDGLGLPRAGERRSTSPPGGASRSSPHGGIPLPELDSAGDVVLVLGAEREGLPTEVLERCDAASLDPAARRRRVAQRRDGRHDRALRARPPRPAVLTVTHLTSLSACGVAATARTKKKSGPLAGAGPKIHRVGFAFVRLVQPALRLGIAPSSSDRSVEVSTYSRSVLGARRNLRERRHRIKTPRELFVAICERIIFDARSRRCPRRRRTAAGRTSRSTRAPRSRPRRGATCQRAGSTHQSVIVDAPCGPRTDSVSVCASRSQSARSSMPGSRSIQRPCVSSMSSWDGVKTSKTSRPPGREQLARRAQRLEPLLVVAQVEIRAERTRHERDALVDRRAPQVAEPQVEPLGDAGLARALAADREHPGRGVDADHVHAGQRGGNRDPSGSDAELDDRRRPPRAPRRRRTRCPR